MVCSSPCCRYCEALGMLESLLAGTKKSQDPVDYAGRTPLLLAAEHNNLAAAQRLIERGADINAKGGDQNRSVLHHAVMQGPELQLLKLLLSSTNIAVESIDHSTCTPFILAVQECNLGAMRLLLERGANGNVMHHFARRSFGRAYTCTALHHAAASKDRLVMLNVLLSSGRMELDKQDSKGYTALLCAVQRGCLSAVKKLVKHGADVNARNGFGDSALHFAAAQHNGLDMVRCLASHANVALDAKNDNGATPLDVASGDSRKWLASHLLRLRTMQAQATLALELGAAPLARAKLIVLGLVEAGKTTLVSNLKPISRKWLGAASTASGSASGRQSMADATIGVEVSVIKINNPLARGSSEFSVLDFGGHPEFYITNETVMTDNRGVFVVVLSLKDQPAERRKQADFWTQFIASALPVPESNAPLPKVILVLSHSDQPAKGRRDAAQLIDGTWFSAWGDAILEEYMATFNGRLLFHPEPFVVNCTNGDSKAIKRLRAALCSMHTVLQKTSPPVVRAMDDVLAKLPALRQEHRGWPIVRYNVLQEWLGGVHRKLSAGPLFEACVTYLESVGEVVAFPVPVWWDCRRSF
eukprot:m.100159 g.100159  ORF g.100159 m.100159 type:complete len:586 (-) comp15379_c0_seq1:1930-3687(-)